MLGFSSWEETKFISNYVENWVLKNLSTICTLLVFYLLGILVAKWLWSSLSLSYEFLYTMIGAIIVFWYTYKRYERDKEMEIIEKYTNKYNVIKKDNDHQELLSLFYEEYYLYSRGFISNILWSEWSEWIYLDIFNLIGDDIKNKTSIFSDNFSIYFWYNSGHNIEVNWKNFLLFIIEIINDLKKTSEIQMNLVLNDGASKLPLDKSEKKRMLEENQTIVAYCESLIEVSNTFYQITIDIDRQK